MTNTNTKSEHRISGTKKKRLILLYSIERVVIFVYTKLFTVVLALIEPKKIGDIYALFFATRGSWVRPFDDIMLDHG